MNKSNSSVPVAVPSRLGSIQGAGVQMAGLVQLAFVWLILACQAPPAVAQVPSPPPPKKMTVNSVRVEGNTLLAEGTLAEIVAGLRGTDRSMSDLTQVAMRIQGAYRDAGYGGVVAFVPEQEITAGNVVIRVVEGRLANIRVSGNRYFESTNVRAGLPNLREGVTPVVRAIDRDIQLTNENPAKEVKVTLTAGSKAGEIDANVEVADKDPFQLLFGYNNTGNEATGRDRISVGVQHSNLLGQDHVATVQYQTSPEKPDQVSVFSVGYRVPLYSKAASVDAFYAYSNVSNGTTLTPAGPLSFAGKGSILGLRGNLNFDRIGEYDHRLILGLDLRKYENDCSLGDFGAAGCGSAGVSVSVVPVSLAYTGQKQGPQLSWGVNASVSANAGGSSRDTFEAARPGARRNYLISRFSGFSEAAIASGFAIHGRVDVQYSGDALISGEKFGLGGASSVRGYTERELTGDYGFAARIEVLGPVIGSDFRVRPLLFVDHGRVANHKDMPCRAITETSCKLTGAGVGARLSIGKYTSASIDIGRAMETGIATSSGDVRAHVSVNVIY